MTLRACTPPDGVPWLNKLGYRMMNAAKPVRPKLPRMASVSALVTLGELLMAGGLYLLEKGKRSGAVVYRDGLIFALLIHRPLRVGNFSNLHIGTSFLIDEMGMSIDFDADETKTHAQIRQAVPESLLPAIEIYLNQVRPLLIRQADPGWLWLGRRGNRLTEQDFAGRIRKMSQRHLGIDLSPHLFRDCAATQIALSAPDCIGITKDILKHATLASSQKFYNQATSFTTFAAHEDVIRRMRDEDSET
jgi:integrase/recombinase XerC